MYSWTLQLQQEREEEAKKRTGKKGAAKEAVMGWGCWAGPGAPAPLTQPTVDKKAKGRGQRPPPKHEQRALQPVKPQVSQTARRGSMGANMDLMPSQDALVPKVSKADFNTLC